MWRTVCPKCGAEITWYQEGFLVITDASVPLTCGWDDRTGKEGCGFEGTAKDFGYTLEVPTLDAAWHLTNEYPEYFFIYTLDEPTRHGIEVRVYVYDNPTIAETIGNRLVQLFPCATQERIDVSTRQVFYHVTVEKMIPVRSNNETQ